MESNPMTTLSDSMAAVRSIAWPDFPAEVLAIYKPPLRAKATCDKLRQALGIVGDLIGPGAVPCLPPRPGPPRAAS
jgi:hypothetical protein